MSLSSGSCFRPRPPLFPASEAISRRRSAESVLARALPPLLANSVMVSGFFFMSPNISRARHASRKAHAAPRRPLSIREAFSGRGESDRHTADAEPPTGNADVSGLTGRPRHRHRYPPLPRRRATRHRIYCAERIAAAAPCNFGSMIHPTLSRRVKARYRLAIIMHGIPHSFSLRVHSATKSRYSCCRR